MDQINKIWKEKGMYRTAGHFDTSPYVIRYLAHKHEWKRPAEKAPAILQGVKNGNLNPDNYKTLDFSNCTINQQGYTNAQ